MVIEWSKRSQNDLEKIANYLGARNPKAAIKTIKTIRQSVSLLLDHPEAGRIGRLNGTRELVVLTTPYLIAYNISESRKLTILAVVHGAQDWPETL